MMGMMVKGEGQRLWASHADRRGPHVDASAKPNSSGKMGGEVTEKRFAKSIENYVGYGNKSEAI